MSLNFSRQRSATITPRTGPSPNADSVTPRDGASAGSNSSFTDAALDSPSSTSGGDRALIQSLIRRQQQMVNELNTYRKLYAEHAQVKAELAEVRKLKSDADADITALSEKLETLRREGAVAEAKAAEASAEASEQRGKAASFEKLLGEERHYSRNREDELTALRVKLQEVSGELAVARSAQQDVDQLRQRLKEAEDAHTLTVSKLDGLAVENLQLANETDVLRLRLAEQSTALAEVKRQAESAAAMSHKASSNSGGVGEWECVQELRAQLANAQAALKEAEESAALDREAVRSSTQDLERLYRDFLVCCDTFNGAVASPPQSSDEAAQHLQTTNHALSNLASRLDVIVERDGGYAEEPHLKLLADVLSYAIHTTSAIQSHAAQGMCLEADLGDALYHEAEMSMLIAMRRVMKEQSGAAQRTR